MEWPGASGLGRCGAWSPQRAGAGRPRRRSPPTAPARVALPSSRSVPDSRSDAVTQSPTQETLVRCDGRAILRGAARDTLPSGAAGSGPRTTDTRLGRGAAPQGTAPASGPGCASQTRENGFDASEENKRLRAAKSNAKPRADKRRLTRRLLTASSGTTVTRGVFLALKKKRFQKYAGA